MNDVRRTVLVVEDDFALGEALRQCLDEEGCWEVTVAARLDEAKRALAAVVFDVALLDLNLFVQGETSEELLEQMSIDQRAPLTVLMSASPTASEIARRFGVPLLSKPFDLDALFATMARGRRPVTASHASGSRPIAAVRTDIAPARRR